jgi:hypothetical protein
MLPSEQQLSGLIERYLRLFPAEPVPPEEIRAVEEGLGVILPSDMKRICSVFSGGSDIGNIEQFKIALEGPFSNIGRATLEVRHAIGLPTRFVILVELDESVVVLETQPNQETPTPVYWLSSIEIESLITGEPLIDVDIYPSYADYFEAQLVDEEEERQQS